jgi:hypothetical protein
LKNNLHPSRFIYLQPKPVAQPYSRSYLQRQARYGC